MKNTYQISLKEISPQGLPEMFLALQKGFQVFGIDFFLLGAFARDIWTTHLHNIRTQRATQDIDLAILLSKSEEYDELISYLVENENFTTTKNKFCLLFKQRIQVDIMPFGEIEQAENYDAWSKTHNFRPISTLGLQEAYQNSLVISTENDLEFKATSLEAIVVLKLISWNDRPEHRQKDAKDLAFILENYFDIMRDVIFDDHFDLIDDNFDTQICSARVLGRLITAIFAENEVLKTQIIQILTTQTTSKISNLATVMMRDSEEYEKYIQLLKAILEGVKDKINKNF
jgi:predicted nucleotidyltransferase